MVRIRGEKRKRVETNDAHFPSPKHPITPSSSSSSADWWDNFSTRLSGPLCKGKNLATFESFFKVSRKTFDYICGLVKEEMMTGLNYNGLKEQALSLNDRVAIALLRLSSGKSLDAISDLLGVGVSSVTHLTWRFVEAIEKKASHHLKWPSTEEDMTMIKSKFEQIRGLPNCCGAIDTTNIMFCLSSRHPTFKIWGDRENKPCMTLQAIVDPDMRFLDVLTGLPGSLSDSHVLCNGSFFNLTNEGKRLNGKKLKLAEGVEELGEYIVGDEEFPLLPWLQTPYQNRKLSDDEENFNKRHYQTWKVAKEAFKRLKETWQVIGGVMWTPDKHKLPRIIYTCCVLHNIMIDQNDGMQDERNPPHSPHPINHSPVSQQQQHKCKFKDKTAVAQREKLALYLSAKLPACIQAPASAYR